jgi:nucleotide-binding universal stress UspA family protein
MYKSIAVGVDGSETARAAMLKAAGIAEMTGARVHLVMASPKGRLAGLAATDAISAGAAEALARAEQELDTAAHEKLKQAAEELRAKKVDVETYVVEDDPAQAICAVAETAGADLIIVGNKGMHGAKRYVLGSVPNSVAHHAPCDVTIVRTT